MKATYARRAATYDNSTGGYHIDLARDFVQMIDPQPGETVLDVACGTGLVAIDVAQRVGPTGKVVAADWSLEMQDVGKAKVSAQVESGSWNNHAKIQWILADITSDHLLEQDAVQKVLEEHSGFDIITCCQGYMQLPDLQGAVSFWAKRLLKPGGRMISDMTTEDPTLQYLITYHLPRALDPSVNLSSGRVNITKRDDFEDLFRKAGLDILRIIRTKLYGPDYHLQADEKTGMKVLEGEIERNLPWVPDEKHLQMAKRVWPQIWRNAATIRADGSRGIESRHPFYLCVGRKPL